MPEYYAGSNLINQGNDRNLIQIVDAFEQAWQSDRQPVIDEWLPVDASLRQAVLLKLVYVDLDYRLRTCETVRVEAYLARYPELTTDSKTLLELIGWEYTLRSRQTGDLNITEYRERFPQLQEALSERLLEISKRQNSIPGADTDSGINFSTKIPVKIAPRCPAGSNETLETVLSLLTPPLGTEELGWLGEFRVVEVLGQGGMGVVFRGEDVKLEREVALKVMRPALAISSTARQRFLREARAMAALKHENIVAIYHSGEAKDVAFLVMELLNGESLDKSLRSEKPLPLLQTIRIGRQIAAGLAAAHSRQVIHRDIKPGNVFLEKEGGRVKLLDFGLAQSASEAHALTQEGMILGTPQYMAPEQARGEPVDARADIFRLGCVLYHMATGTRPFTGATSGQVLAAIEMKDPVPPRKLNSGIPERLEQLILHLLAKNAANRPASVVHVRNELNLVAKDAKLDEQIQKFDDPLSKSVLDNQISRPGKRSIWLTVVLGGSVAAAMVAAIVYFQTPQGEFTIETNDPKIAILIEENGLEIHDKVSGRKYVLKPGKTQLPTGEYEIDAADVQAGLQLSTRRFSIKRGRQESVIVSFKPAPGITETFVKAEGLLNSLRRDRISSLELEIAGGGDAARAPPEIVAIVGEARLRHWDEALGFAFSQDGSQLLTGGATPSWASLWDVANGRQVNKFFPERKEFGGILSVAFLPRGQGFVWGGQTGEIEARDPDGRKLFDGKSHIGNVNGLAVSPNGKWLASAGADHTIRLSNIPLGKLDRPVLRHSGPVSCLAFSSRGDLLGVVGEVNNPRQTGEIKLWNPDQGKEIWTLPMVQSQFAGAFSPDGSRLVTAGRDGVLAIRDAVNGEITNKIKHNADILTVAISPDGRLLAYGDNRGFAVVHDFKSGKTLYEKPHFAKVSRLAFHPTKDILATIDRAGTIRFWNSRTGADLLGARYSHSSSTATLSPNGKTLAIGFQDRVARLYDLSGVEPDRLPMELRHENRVLCNAFSPDGRLLATGSDTTEKNKSTAKIWDVSTGKELFPLKNGHSGAVRQLAFRPDGKYLATAGEDALVYVWEVATGQRVGKLEGHSKPVMALAYSPTDNLLLTGSYDGSARLWDVTWEKELLRLAADSQEVRAVSFSSDGKLLLTGGRDGNLKWWDRSGMQANEWHLTGDRRAGILGISVHPRKKRLAVSGSRFISILDESTRVTLKTIPGVFYLGELFCSQFSPDGHHLVAGTSEGQTWILRLPSE